MWKAAQEFEIEWHKHQQFNSYNEETKQYIYASKMGLDLDKTNYYGQVGWDFGDNTVLDIGGSGQSILLKCKAKKRVVVDPIMPSKWMMARYKEAGITFYQAKGEDYKRDTYDITLGYNVLQHTENPEKIIKNVRSYSKVIHWFDWIDEPISPGHIHILTEEGMNKWFSGEGKAEFLNSSPCIGNVWYGVFKGDI
jgi:2-polyprenyl-3-methyl-5-hydroxy-6-metoxy-1,4-benzoquinol methylase